MESQNTINPLQHASTCLSGPVGPSQQPGRHATTAQPEAPPPEPYNPITTFQREMRWEQIVDIDGSLWEVREARATKHGFDLLFGFPANSRISRKFVGPKRLIASPSLVAYWEINRTNEGASYDLPAGRSTIKRIRKRLRFDLFRDRRNLWKQRIADLTTLPTKECAERYNVDPVVVCYWRQQLAGRLARPLDWWKHPQALAVLRTPGITQKAIGQALNIGTSQAHRLRLRALAVDPTLLEQPAPGPIVQLGFELKPTLPPIRTPFLYNQNQGEFFANSEFWNRRKRQAPALPGNTPAIAESKPRRKGHKHSHSQSTSKRLGQLMLPFKASRVSKAMPVLFQVQDFQNTFYDVYEFRPTKHGFNLLFGYKTKAHRRIYASTDKAKPGLILPLSWSLIGNRFAANSAAT